MESNKEKTGEKEEKQSRIKVEKLDQPLKELGIEEAKKVKGGGGGVPGMPKIGSGTPV